MIEKVSLCKDDQCCPVVEVETDAVRIGEEGNMVVLSKEEWNNLVDKVKRGELQAL